MDDNIEDRRGFLPVEWISLISIIRDPTSFVSAPRSEIPHPEGPSELADSMEVDEGTQMVYVIQNLIGEMRNMLMQFKKFSAWNLPWSASKIDCHVISAISSLETLENEVNVSPFPEKEEWIDLWQAFLMSLTSHEKSSELTSAGDCPVCFETNVDIFRYCKTGSHVMCAPCLLNHCWEDTKGIRKTFARCPMCRSEFCLSEMAP